MGEGVDVTRGLTAPTPPAAVATCKELKNEPPVEIVPVLEMLEVKVLAEPIVAVF